jgi:hypothetical protein
MSLSSLRQRGRAVSLSAALVVVTLVVGCGSDAAVVVEPAVSVTVNGIAMTGTTASHNFAPDTTRGQISQSVEVAILNSDDLDPLTIESITWTNDNEFIGFEYSGSFKPIATDFPLVREVGSTSLRIRATYQPNADIVDKATETLTIRTNAQGSEELVITFGIEESGPKIQLDQASYVFKNPSASLPPTQCFKWTNIGQAPLIFDSALLDPPSAFYEVVSTPNNGDFLSPYGSAPNPISNPAKQEICVRLTPSTADPTGVDYDTKLVVKTNDPVQGSALISLSVEWSLDNKFVLTCTDATGNLVYDFSAQQGGCGSKVCNVQNLGPEPFKVNAVEIEAYASLEQDAVWTKEGGGMFSVAVEKISGDEVTSFPFAFPKNQSRNFKVTYCVPNEGGGKNAELVISYSQANKPDDVRIPINASSCQTPAVAYAPALSAGSLWLRADVGSESEGTVAVSNQSCAPLQVIKACTEDKAPTAASKACSGGNDSAAFALTGAVGLQAIAPWTVLPVGIKFAPQNNTFVSLNHFLNVVYCPGTWDGEACDGELAFLSINLEGSLDADVELPTVAINSPIAPKLGEKVTLTAAAQQGTYPLSENGGFLWMVLDRPAGSGVWFSADKQLTTPPEITFVPDVAGSYTIGVAVQSFDPSSLAEAWSLQATSTFEISAE